MKVPESNTTQNLLRLLRSVDERSVALGLEIHKSNPTPESTILLESYQKLYALLFQEPIDSLKTIDLVKLNDPILDLHHQQLDALPPEIGQLIQLQELYLGRNKLTSLPMEIGQLTQLHRLGLKMTPLSEDKTQ